MTADGVDRAGVDQAGVDRAGVERVLALIRPHVRRTPVIRVTGRDLGLDCAEVVLKLEHLQHGGSFKARGAFANLLLRPVPEAGVVAASGGNHGAAVALAAHRLGRPAAIFVPTVSSPAKVARIRAYGVEPVVTGSGYSEALAAADAWAARTGAMPVHAFDAAETVLGAGTTGLELREQAPDVTTVLASVGGGGLLAGIAAACAGSARVVGVEPEGAPTPTEAIAAGEPVDAPVGSVAVDSLAPRRIGALTFGVIREFAKGAVLVSDDDIRSARRLLWDRLRIVAEPGGCTALAALTSGRLTLSADDVAGVVISGANTDAVDLDRI